jgi:hypothetical protein
MSLLSIILFLFMWWAIGVCGYIFWWTTEYDFTTKRLTLAIYAGICGPMSWYIGWRIHGKSNDIIILQRRKDRQ